MEKQIFSVSELNNRIKGLLDLDPVLLNVAVKGELSNYKVYPSGHHYFTIKDNESSLKCVLFRSSAARLRFRPENGMSVIVYGRVNVYMRDGVYQLTATGMMPLGVGDLQMAFEQLKEKLDAEGLFSQTHKKPLPVFPERIAVITSSAGAAVHDMIRILSHRWPLSKVIVMPVRVQGIEAPGEIADAIKYANAHNVADVIITGRGGGSIEDLWAFNDERVARAIYASNIPVISAVGHEPDVTISDYVADRRASTPSNAAEIAVPDINDVYSALNNLSDRHEYAMQKRLDDLRQRLDNLSTKRVLLDPSVYIDNRRLELDRICDKLISAEEKSVLSKKQQFYALSAALDAMSPLKVLSRGYAVTIDEDGKLLKSVSEIHENDRITVRLSDGTVKCEAKEIISQGENN